MFRNYLITAWRTIVRSKLYSGLNILGLSMGMAVALLIGLWVFNECSYDDFLPNNQQLYLVRRNYYGNGDTVNYAGSSLKLADALRNRIPEIQYVAETDGGKPHGLMVGDKKLYRSGTCVAGDFLKMFQFSMAQGNIAAALNDPYSIVLTQGTAKALFGDANPINKIVRFDDKDNLTVTGILDDLPANSTLKFSYLVPFSYLEATDDFTRRARHANFEWNAFQLFVYAKPGVSYAQLSNKIKSIEHSDKDNFMSVKTDVLLQPLQHWHLYARYENGQEAGGIIQYVRMFSMIGLFVLLIATINFINLTTARSEKRAREVGVRKAIGSQRKHLILQFLLESLVLTLIAFFFSLMLVQLSLSDFNRLAGTEIHLPLSNASYWLVLLGGVLVTAVAAGGRPAFYLSSFHPAKVLKGPLQTGGASTIPRKILVVLQFSCSIALIISTITIYRQIQHARNRPAGYDMNRLVTTDMNNDLAKNYGAIKHEMLEKGIAESITWASVPITGTGMHRDVEQWPGKRAGETVDMGRIVVPEGYFKTMGMTLKEGRDFAGPADTLNVIFNEAAVKLLRLKAPLNQTIGYWDSKMKIIGIVKDALTASPYMPADPTIFFYDPYPRGAMMYRISAQVSPHSAIRNLTTLFNKYNPAFPFDYRFADASYAAKFDFEVLVGRLSGLFAAFAVFISCLGLFGLAAYLAERRTKEIGIRKVMGASVSSLWLMLSKEFILLVSISSCIASPIAFYFLQGWLQKYSYRVDIGFKVFLISAFAAVVITLLTISFQAIKAATANPVKSLRTE
jgi:ABC-type antimicrobial peptide transport system permease subunit